MSDTYILDQDGNPQPEPDRAKWQAWMDAHSAPLDVDTVGQFTIVTSFLGEDKRWLAAGLPLLFQTTVTRDGESSKSWHRSCTREQALEEHSQTLRFYRNRRPQVAAPTT